MSKQDKQEPDNEQPAVEDLATDEDKAEEVKGGTGGVWYLKCDVLNLG